MRNLENRNSNIWSAGIVDSKESTKFENLAFPPRKPALGTDWLSARRAYGVGVSGHGLTVSETTYDAVRSCRDNISGKRVLRLAATVTDDRGTPAPLQ